MLCKYFYVVANETVKCKLPDVIKSDIDLILLHVVKPFEAKKIS